MAEASFAHGPTLAATSPGNGERLAAGATAGDYVVEQFLGAGAMGEVYAGRHPVIGKRVAIKVLRRELATSPEASERFVREARAVNQVAHPSVVDVFAFGRLDDGRHYLVMDLIEGQSLRAALAAGPLEVRAALAILGEIADALDAAHARGVVHRDLKPDNVMLGSGTPPKVFVLDFGIAKLVAADGATGNGTLTGQGTWLGTPGYMAPEQWSADGAGPASDRYALGVTAYELLSGKLPFSATTLPGMMEQHFRSPVPALVSMRGKVDGQFDAVLQRAMAKQPEARFPTGRAMVDALRAAAAGERVGALPRRSWVPAAAASGLLALSIGAVVWTRNGADRTPEPAAVTPPPVPGQIALAITTIPSSAEVKNAGQLVGGTPLTIRTPPGGRLVLDVRKPGYRVEHRELAADHDTQLVVTLEAIDGFNGVWRLDTGELRAFQRAGERVDVFKLDAVTGPRTPYRTYDFVASDDNTVDFAHDEDVTDARGADARCHVPHHVRYHYDPKLDALVVQRERVGVAIDNGSCIVVSRDPGARVALARVDTSHDDVRYSEGPAGPVIGKRPRTNNTASNALKASQGKAAKLAKSARTNAAMDNTLDDALDTGAKSARTPDANQDAPDSQIRATPKASPPPPDTEPQQALPQQQSAPPQPAPPQANAPVPQAPQQQQQRVKK